MVSFFADIKAPIKVEDVKSEVKTEVETPAPQIGPINDGGPPAPPKKEEEYDSSATVRIFVRKFWHLFTFVYIYR